MTHRVRHLALASIFFLVAGFCLWLRLWRLEVGVPAVLSIFDVRGARAVSIASLARSTPT